MDTDAGQVTDGDITIDSNHETVEQIQAAIVDDAPDVVEASPSDDASDETSSQEAPIEADTATPPKPKRRSDPTQAVKSAVAKQRQAERRAEAAEAQMQAMVTPVTTEPTPGGGDWARFKQIPGVPTVDQFDAYEDYSMAMSAFVADVRHHERDAERASSYQAHQQQQSQDAQTAAWNGRLSEARAQNPDFDSTLKPDTPMSLPMQHLAMESPQGIEILQWLSDNPNESQRISTLHPAETYREMGKIEARLEAAPPRASARAVSSAKSPIRPLGTSPHMSDQLEITDDMSFDEHFRRANAADRATGRL
jgi:hypothetical protein|tara:strand:+ start:4589 stop:5512 length:924 start_codon:yes stop_codon:yes gene_type:complete